MLSYRFGTVTDFHWALNQFSAMANLTQTNVNLFFQELPLVTRRCFNGCFKKFKIQNTIIFFIEFTSTAKTYMRKPMTP